MPSERKNLLSKYFGRDLSPSSIETRRDVGKYLPIPNNNTNDIDNNDFPSILPAPRLKPSLTNKNVNINEENENEFPTNLPNPRVKQLSNTLPSPKMSSLSTITYTTIISRSRQGTKNSFNQDINNQCEPNQKRNGEAMFEGIRPPGPSYSHINNHNPESLSLLTNNITTNENHNRITGNYGTCTINNNNNIPPPPRNRIQSIQDDIDDTVNITHDTVVNLLERGETIRDIQRRANNLGVVTDTFRRTAQERTELLRQSSRWRRIMINIALGCLIFILICTIVWLRQQPF